MADNVTTPLDGKTFATDEVNGVHYTRTKIVFGADGEALDVSPSARFPVALPDGFATAEGQNAIVQAIGAIAPGGDASAGGQAAIIQAIASQDYTRDVQPVSATELPLPAGAATLEAQAAQEAATRKLGTARRWFAITPDGNADLPVIPDAVTCEGEPGDVVLKGDDGENATFYFAKGQTRPLSPSRVLATGTSATGLIGLIS